jgi:hypothetical protein
LNWRSSRQSRQPSCSGRWAEKALQIRFFRFEGVPSVAAVILGFVAIDRQVIYASSISRRDLRRRQARRRGELLGPRLALIAACGSGFAVAVIAVQQIL